jgi:hypothetical protein
LSRKSQQKKRRRKMKRICLVSLATVLLVSLISMNWGGVATTRVAPTDLTCQWVSSSQIDLSWNASSGADGYKVYRCTGASCTPTASVHNESTTSWSDSGLTSNTTYRYRLTAYNEAGESDYSSIVNCTTYNPEVAWNQTFGGSGDDYGCPVQQTSDGGYVVAGYTSSYGAGRGDAWLIKTDSSGNLSWNKTFGGSDYDEGYSVQQTSEGGYIIAGSTESYGAGFEDVWLIKTDSLGDETWNKTFGGSDIERGYSVQQSSDGGYIIAGSAGHYGAGSANVWLIKTDSSGDETWNKTFDDSHTERGYSVQQTSDGGYIMVGDTYPQGTGTDDVWLMKTDSSGDELWNKTFGGPNSDCGLSVQQTSDGGYVIAGITTSHDAHSLDVWLIKITA